MAAKVSLAAIGRKSTTPQASKHPIKDTMFISLVASWISNGRNRGRISDQIGKVTTNSAPEYRLWGGNMMITRTFRAPTENRITRYWGIWENRVCIMFKNATYEMARCLCGLGEIRPQHYQSATSAMVQSTTECKHNPRYLNHSVLDRLLSLAMIVAISLGVYCQNSII